MPGKSNGKDKGNERTYKIEEEEEEEEEALGPERKGLTRGPERRARVKREPGEVWRENRDEKK